MTGIKTQFLVLLGLMIAALALLGGKALAAKPTTLPGWGWGDAEQNGTVRTGPPGPGAPSVHPVFGS